VIRTEWVQTFGCKKYRATTINSSSQSKIVRREIYQQLNIGMENNSKIPRNFFLPEKGENHPDIRREMPLNDVPKTFSK
jgi:hypothetical protein